MRSYGYGYGWRLLRDADKGRGLGIGGAGDKAPSRNILLISEHFLSSGAIAAVSVVPIGEHLRLLDRMLACSEPFFGELRALC